KEAALFESGAGTRSEGSFGFRKTDQLGTGERRSERARPPCVEPAYRVNPEVLRRSSLFGNRRNHGNIDESGGTIISPCPGQLAAGSGLLVALNDLAPTSNKVVPVGSAP